MTNGGQAAAFDEAMLSIYQQALTDVGYKATRFFQMLQEHGGVQTAHILLHSETISEGYTAMWERGRLDLTVEAVIHDNPQWHSLFTPEELNTCTNRLVAYGYLAH